jgi:hypothetical protein
MFGQLIGLLYVDYDDDDVSIASLRLVNLGCGRRPFQGCEIFSTAWVYNRPIAASILKRIPASSQYLKRILRAYASE